MDIPELCKCKTQYDFTIQMQRKQNSWRKYQHGNKGAKIQVLGDVQNASHAV